MESAHVRSETRNIAEDGFAIVAAVHFSSVHILLHGNVQASNVSSQIAPLAGSVRAQSAAVGLFTSMDGSLMTHQRVLLAEASIALITLESERKSL